MLIEWSWRYGVIGVYRDRDGQVIRIYPIPFIRISYFRGPRDRS